MYRHPELEHRHIHRYQDEGDDDTYGKYQYRFGHIVELPDFIFKFRIGLICLSIKHFFKRVGFFTHFQQDYGNARECVKTLTDLSFCHAERSPIYFHGDCKRNLTAFILLYQLRQVNAFF